MVDTIIDVIGAIFSRESGFALTSVVGKVVDTFSAILARCEFWSGTKRDFGLAEFTRESSSALALIRSDFIDTTGIVLASVANAIIRVDFASNTFESQRTNAPAKL